MDEKYLERFQQAAERKELVYLSAKNIRMTFQSNAVGISDTHLRITSVIPYTRISEVNSQGEFYLQVGGIRLTSQTLNTDGVDILFPLEQAEDMEEFRGEKRFSFSTGIHVHCLIQNPHDMTTTLKKPVLDLSNSGLSFRNGLFSKAFYRGLKLPKIEVFIDGNPHIQVSGQVVYCRNLLDRKKGEAVQVGIKFEQA